VYVHVPFCRHRCGYCDFTLIAGRDDLRDSYLDALERELAVTCADQSARVRLRTLFFGGGTPSHLTSPQLVRLFSLLRRYYDWDPPQVPSEMRNGEVPAAEISFEANPLDCTEELLEQLAALGVNRLSLGVQSFDAETLRVLERDHTPDLVRRVLPRARAWFPNLSIDLMFGVPGLSLSRWRDGLREALDWGVAHVSTYGLTFEPGTAFETRRRRGELHRVDEELERAQYELAMDLLSEGGFEQYEISNFARPGRECQHNLNYWQGGSYAGFGPGAARFVNGRRETNVRSTLGYLARLARGLSPTAEIDAISAEARARERIFLGLRMTAGLSRTEFRQHTGFDLDVLAGAALGKCRAAGWLADDGDRIQLTREGRFVADRVAVEFL
jgi:oxygen-independent coproporphyrinogen-3 oxidase